MAEYFMKPSRRVTNMIAKELRLIVKDRVALFLIFLLPAALIGMLWWVSDQNVAMGQMSSMSNDGSGTNTMLVNDTNDLDSGLVLGIIDRDTTRTYDGPDLSENFTGYLDMLVDVLRPYNNTGDAVKDLYEGNINGFVVIPDGFEANLTINEPTYIEVHIDATALTEQSQVMGVVQAATVYFRSSKMWIRSEVFPSMTIEFAPDADFVQSTFGGFIVVFSSYLGIAMTSAQSIVGDAPLRRMLLTPTNRLEIVVAKSIAYVIIGFFQSLLLITLWVIAFDLNLNTGFLTLVIIMSLTSLTGSATGILISSIASSRLQANQMFLFVLFGTLILSGFFIDVGAIDEVLPLNQGLRLLIDTAFKGLNLFQVTSRVIRLVGFSVIAMLVATLVYSKKPTLG
ncbi:MAG: ABC transporter permease [Candidatus Thorarchaeota archaeon]